MNNEIEYEDDPWGDGTDINDMQIVEDLLPPAEEMKRSIFRVFTGKHQFFSFPEEDMNALSAIAKQQGESATNLLGAIIHQYIESHKPSKPNA